MMRLKKGNFIVIAVNDYDDDDNDARRRAYIPLLCNARSSRER